MPISTDLAEWLGRVCHQTIGWTILAQLCSIAPLVVCPIAQRACSCFRFKAIAGLTLEAERRVLVVISNGTIVNNEALFAVAVLVGCTRNAVLGWRTFVWKLESDLTHLAFKVVVE